MFVYSDPHTPFYYYGICLLKPLPGPSLDWHNLTNAFVVLAVFNALVTMAAGSMIYCGNRLRILTAGRYQKFVEGLKNSRGRSDLQSSTVRVT